MILGGKAGAIWMLRHLTEPFVSQLREFIFISSAFFWKLQTYHIFVSLRPITKATVVSLGELTVVLLARNTVILYFYRCFP